MNVEQLMQILGDIPCHAAVEVCCDGSCPVDDSSMIKDVFVITRHAPCEKGLVSTDDPVVVIRYE